MLSMITDPNFLRTPESIFEVLWGVTIAYFVVRTALLYSALTIASAFVARLLVLAVSRPLGLRIADHPGFTVLVVYVVFCSIPARRLMAACGVPRSLAFRLGIGAVTYGLLRLVDLVFGFGPLGDGRGLWGPASGYMERLVPGIFGGISLLPVTLMFGESDADKKPRGRKRAGEKVEGERSPVKDLEEEKIPDSELESEERRVGEAKDALIGENPRWLSSEL